MKLALYVRSLKPEVRWGIRCGNKFRQAIAVEIHIPMVTVESRKAPHLYLRGDGICTIRGGVAYLTREKAR